MVIKLREGCISHYSILIMNQPGAEHFTEFVGDLWESLCFALLHLTHLCLQVSWKLLIFGVWGFIFIPLAFRTNASYAKCLHQYCLLIGVTRMGRACYCCQSSTLSYQWSLTSGLCFLCLMNAAYCCSWLSLPDCSVGRNQRTHVLAKLQTVGPFCHLKHEEIAATKAIKNYVNFK